MKVEKVFDEHENLIWILDFIFGFEKGKERKGKIHSSSKEKKKKKVMNYGNFSKKKRSRGQKKKEKKSISVVCI